MSFLTVKKSVFSALLGFALLTPAVQAGMYSSVIVYGDSLSDNGNLYAAAGVPGAPYYAGRRSDGPVAVEKLAAALGAPLIDFAWIGATTGLGNYGDGGSTTSLGAFSLPGMAVEFAATQSAITPYASSALFVVWGGANDFLAPSSLDTTPAAIIARAVANELAIVTALQTMGAQNILVPGLPDLGLTPYFQSLPNGAATGSALTDAFNQALHGSLPTGVLFYDTAALVRDMVAHPANYGFTNVTDPCFTGTTLCQNPSEYLFFDAFHPTTATAGFAADGMTLMATPEPATAALLLGGLALCLKLRRKSA